MYLARDRDQWWDLVNIVTVLQVAQNMASFLTSWMTFGFPRTLLHGVIIFF